MFPVIRSFDICFEILFTGTQRHMEAVRTDPFEIIFVFPVHGDCDALFTLVPGIGHCKLTVLVLLDLSFIVLDRFLRDGIKNGNSVFPDREAAEGKGLGRLRHLFGFFDGNRADHITVRVQMQYNLIRPLGKPRIFIRPDDRARNLSLLALMGVCDNSTIDLRRVRLLNLIGKLQLLHCISRVDSFFTGFKSWQVFILILPVIHLRKGNDRRIFFALGNPIQIFVERGTVAEKPDLDRIRAQPVIVVIVVPDYLCGR